MIQRLQTIFYTTYTVFLLFSLGSIQASGTWALVKVPSTDLSLERLSRFQGAPRVYYNQFPHAPDKGFSSCLRIHQLKFNELVKVHTCLKDEVECEVQHFFYRGHDKKEYKRFWALKSDLVFLKDLPSKTVLSHIPPPYRMTDPVSRRNNNVLSLTIPWFDKVTGMTYSAGTRFVRCASKDTKTHYAIFVIAGDSLKSHVSHVPRSASLIAYPQGPSQAATLFVGLLQKWAQGSDGIIPYVFGGCSYNKRITPRGFSLMSDIRLGEEVSFWQRKHLQPGIVSGFDCSSMILCAAQICGIPYFYKNTFTLYHAMEALKKQEKLQEGDILWYSGHVMVVSTIKKNLLIEAAGYDTGHGRVHEIEVRKVFKNVENYQELVTAYEKGIPLERLHSNGSPLKMVYDLKIFTLKSLWRKR